MIGTARRFVRRVKFRCSPLQPPQCLPDEVNGYSVPFDDAKVIAFRTFGASCILRMT
jgi:hypothetical protein